MLNHPTVRQGLIAGGLEIAADTWVVPAVHNTTRDEIDFFDADLIPASHTASHTASHAADFATTVAASKQAGQATLTERLA